MYSQFSIRSHCSLRLRSQIQWLWQVTRPASVVVDPAQSILTGEHSLQCTKSQSTLTREHLDQCIQLNNKCVCACAHMTRILCHTFLRTLVCSYTLCPCTEVTWINSILTKNDGLNSSPVIGCFYTKRLNTRLFLAAIQKETIQPTNWFKILK